MNTKKLMATMMATTTLGMLVASAAQAWTGPRCFTDADREITLTVRDTDSHTLKVSFDDDDGELQLVSVSPDPARPGAQKVVVKHTAGHVGIIGVILHGTPDGDWAYEYEFRSTLEECAGATVQTGE